jgi:hypothetical protein
MRARGKFLRDPASRASTTPKPPSCNSSTRSTCRPGWRAGAVLEDDDDGYRRCYRARWDAWRRDVPAVPMAPLLVGIRHRVHRIGDFPRARQGREDGTRDGSPVGEQTVLRPKEKFSMTWSRARSRRLHGWRRSARCTPSLPSPPFADVYRKYIENDAQHHRQQALEHRQDRAPGGAAEQVRPGPRCPALRGRRSRSASPSTASAAARWISTCSCSAAARTSRDHVRSYATGGHAARVRQGRSSSSTDIVTATTSWNWTSNTSTAALRSCPSSPPTSSSAASAPERTPAAACSWSSASAARPWATTTCRTSACPAASCSTR